MALPMPELAPVTMAFCPFSGELFVIFVSDRVDSISKCAEPAGRYAPAGPRPRSRPGRLTVDHDRERPLPAVAVGDSHRVARKGIRRLDATRSRASRRAPRH